jgi:hypothetical protein
MARAKGQCEGCGTRRATQVHHLTDARPGRQSVDHADGGQPVKGAPVAADVEFIDEGQTVLVKGHKEGRPLDHHGAQGHLAREE